jgi:hypothetical protein
MRLIAQPGGPALRWHLPPAAGATTWMALPLLLANGKPGRAEPIAMPRPQD